MNIKQGAAVALIQTLVTVLIAGIIFAHTWGGAEQKLINLKQAVDGHEERIKYLERK